MSTPTIPVDTVVRAEPEQALALAVDDDLRRQELGAFLRNRRERIAPEQVGVSVTGRRRTPGLRREEVAQLSGVGVTWYTWLEQGRDIHASEQVLGALARTLMLSGAERTHLFTLAGAGEAVVTQCHAVTDTHRRLLAQLDPFPASVQSGKYDVLAFNRSYDALFGMSDVPVGERNCMWLNFTDPTWRERMVDRDEVSTRMVANFRALMADHVGDATWKTLLNRLMEASPEFVELWARHEVRDVENKPKRVRHREHGVLTFESSNTWLAPRAGRRMLAYVPADERTEQVLRMLVSA